MKKDKRDETLEMVYTTDYPPHDIDIEAYKKQIDEHNEKFKHGVELLKQSKSASTPLEIQIQQINDLKDRKGCYPKDDD